MQTVVNQDFKGTFCRERSSFAIQHPGKDWRTSRKPLADNVISKHLNHEFWIGCRAGWYVGFGILDIDSPDLGIVQSVCKSFNLDWKNSLIERSPNKGYHVIFKPRFDDTIPTKRLYFECLEKYEGYLRRELNLPSLEIFPKNTKAIRMPLGRDQAFVDPGSFSPYHLSQDCFVESFEKLDSIDIKELSPQLYLPLKTRQCYRNAEVWYSDRATGGYLYHFGPQDGKSRYDTMWEIIQYLFRLNFSYEEIGREIYAYAKRHQDWFLKNSRHGYETYQRAKRQLNFLRNHESNYVSYPDYINNSEFLFSKNDLVWLIKTFPKKNQQRAVFELLRYYRPRANKRGPWVNIHRDRWLEWTSEHTYKDFQRTLESKNILEANNNYLVGEYAKSFKLNLPSLEGEVKHSGRQVRNFEAALVKAFTRNELNCLLGYKQKTYRIEQIAKDQVVEVGSNFFLSSKQNATHI